MSLRRLKNLLQKVLKNLQKLLLARPARFLRTLAAYAPLPFYLVSGVKPREYVINELSSHNKSLWKGVWGRTFLQKGFPQPPEAKEYADHKKQAVELTTACFIFLL